MMSFQIFFIKTSLVKFSQKVGLLVQKVIKFIQSPDGCSVAPPFPLTADCENTTLQVIQKKIEEKVQFLLSLFVIEDMEYIQAQNRLQMHFSCLEEQIGDSSSIRVLEAFVNKLDLAQLQFTVASLKTEGPRLSSYRVF